MASTVVVSKKHQIAVPAEIRRKLGISSGDRLLVDLQDGVIVIVPVPTSFTDRLRGLGREIWQDEDPQEYINRERGSWDK